MNEFTDWRIEWVVAALAPWTVSPHPNFRVAEPTAAARLALLSDMRSDEIGEGDGAGDEPWEATLLRAAAASLSAPTQRDATRELWEIAVNGSAPPGARAVAAMYAGIGSSELGQSETAADGFGEVIGRLLAGRNEPQGCSPSARLTIAALGLHRAVRLMESGRTSGVLDGVAGVLKWAPGLAERGYDDFAVSDGISWGAVRVQRDIVQAIRSRALSLRSMVESIDGQTWVRVVRGRSSWIDSRLLLRAAERDSIVVRDDFERELESDSKTRYFGRTSSTLAGYRALLLAELAGDYPRILNARESLGKILFIDGATDVAHVREALRLLRHGAASKTLQSALRRVRAQGPSAALVDESQIIVERALRAGWCSEADLLVLENAADFMSGELRDSAIDAAFIALEATSAGDRARWSLRHEAWKSLVRLVPGSSSSERLAAAALEELRLGGSNLLVADTLARLIREIDWSSVAAPLAAEWREYRGGLQSDDDATLADAIDVALMQKPVSAPSDAGLERAAFRVDQAQAEEVDPRELDADARAIIAALQQEADSARNGQLSFGGLSIANVAAAFALKFGGVGVWRALIDHLADTRVDAVLKSLAIDRIARQIDDVPRPERERLAENFSAIQGSTRSTYPLQASRSSIFAEALRLGLALGVVEKADALPTLLKLVSGEVPDRIEAARTIPYALRVGDANWGHALLLQLSLDRDPAVRSQAGQDLIESLRADSELLPSIYERAIALLKSDGVRIPLRVLYGVQRGITEGSARVDPLIGVVETLAESGGNSIIRGAAQAALEMRESRHQPD